MDEYSSDSPREPLSIPPPPLSGSHGWPPICTLAELARILTLIHGVKAPTESSLKKWSAAGAFRSCVASEEEVLAAEAPSPSAAHTLLQRPRRAGRPGLTLRTAMAIGRVYELWPFLGESDPHAVVELVVARTADHLRVALAQATPPMAQASPEPSEEAAERPTPSALALHEIERQLGLLTQEMAAMKKEVAHFSALRNNLITRLDDAVARAKEALTGGVPGGGSLDPLVEARRDRDMGIMKSTLSEILTALQRIEAGNGTRGSMPGTS
ncbi:hypothetical protein C7T35_08035 [Variovorax sp. WS11]|uniref:hypothetical protein n=1 Tax=Variovorax sp. WS11 TaxID=1105204 RepID=UPI000D0D8A36|nr:hypothetical protein [Variovorax sp. WS11]NDZ18512.1 hypothetical protein [Variovorax sp. WS11]PSL85148.1 hypothetical protein C7T35_08035 [Variovorax sp. WS11]